MERLSDKAQSRELDRQAPRYGLSVEVLMDAAGFKSTEWILKTFPKDSFSVFCGPGNNGGDGLTAAFYLKKAGREVQVFAAESPQSLFNKQKRKALSLNIKIKALEDYQPDKKHILIDALFGSGLDRPLEGVFKETVLKINATAQTVLSLDVPSGLCADTGCVLGSAVKASWTLSFALSKTGFYFNEGATLSGRIIVLSIGFPKELLEKTCDSYFLVNKTDVKGFLPSYKDSTNKTDRGHALIAAGKEGMWGCGLLACRSAYTIGSGYVTWAAEGYPYKKSIEIPEALLAQIKDKLLFDNKTAVGAGPGLGFSKSAQKFYLKLQTLKTPVLLDADALTFLAQTKVPVLNKNFVLTPHAGELSRMLKVSSKAVKDDPLCYAKQGAEQYKAWLLLKGFHSILSDGEKNWILNSGNSALGKAGTGDVLTGMITGLMAQGLPPFKACLLGAFLHGKTAEKWLRENKDVNAFSASEIIKSLPFVMAEIRQKN